MLNLPLSNLVLQLCVGDDIDDDDDDNDDDSPDLLPNLVVKLCVGVGNNMINYINRDDVPSPSAQLGS